MKRKPYLRVNEAYWLIFLPYAWMAVRAQIISMNSFTARINSLPVEQNIDLVAACVPGRVCSPSLPQRHFSAGKNTGKVGKLGEVFQMG